MAKNRRTHINRNVTQRNATVDRLRNKLAVKLGPKKICLTMIVRNESKNMVRLFESIKSIIDMISIVDTGSTDNTIEVINNWGTKNSIPTTVHQEPFKNFAYNRTHSVTMAKETYPEADYFLLSDADFVWKIDVGRKFDKVLLTADKYLLTQFNKSLNYHNIRLLSAKLDWECVGRTHEYWRVKGKRDNVRSGTLTTLEIDDREDGGCKQNKFERDEKLLREGLSDPDEEPGLKTRYKFYLGQTLSDVGRFEESTKWYQARIDDGGWAEEVYYSHYKIGSNYELLGWRKSHIRRIKLKKENNQELVKWESEYLEKYKDYAELTPEELRKQSEEDLDSAERYHLKGSDYKKNRAESLYFLARLRRLRGKYQEAYDIIQRGIKIEYPKNDTLFIQRDVYSWKFTHELTFVCYQLEKFDEGSEACKELLAMDNLPDNYKREVEDNCKFYL